MGSRRVPTLLVVALAVLIAAVSFLAGASLHRDEPGVLSSRIPLGAGDSRPAAVTESQLALFQQVWEIVDHEYYGRPLDYDKMMQGALRGMLESLGDPHTQYITPDRNTVMRDDAKGSFEGIGATLDEIGGKFVVIAPMPGSPAEKAGLRAQDVLVAVDGVRLAGLTLTDVILKVRGPVGSKVILTVERPGEELPFDLSIERAEIPVHTVEYHMLDATTGYLSLSSFGSKSVEELDAALDALQRQGARRLVFDLRDNPGGFLDSAVQVVGRFVDHGAALYWQNADGSTREVPVQTRGSVITWPMVVLVNGGSASAAEIVAGALQDYGRAQLAGVKTFGKGSVQNVHELQDGGSIRVTTAHWLTPRRHDIDSVGLAPDVNIERTDDDVQAKRDPQLGWAESYLSGSAGFARWIWER